MIFKALSWILNYMIPTRLHAQLGAPTPAGSCASLTWVSHYLQQKMPAPESSYPGKHICWHSRGFPQPSSPAQHCWLPQGLCSACYLPLFPKHITSCSPGGKDLLQEKKELPALNNIKEHRTTAINCVGVSQQLWDFLPLLLWRGKNSSASSLPGSS